MQQMEKHDSPHFCFLPGFGVSFKGLGNFGIWVSEFSILKGFVVLGCLFVDKKPSIIAWSLFNFQ